MFIGILDPNDMDTTFKSIVNVIRYLFMFIPTFNFGKAMVIVTKVFIDLVYFLFVKLLTGTIDV